MKKTIALMLFAVTFSVTSKAQMKDPHDWVGYEQTLGLKNGLRHYDFNVKTVSTSAPANIFWPGDKVQFTFQLVSNINQPIDMEAKVKIIQYGSKGVPNDIWLPEMYHIKDVQTIPVQLSISPNGYQNVTINPEISNVYGGYAVVFDLGKHGSQLGTSFVRSMKPSSEKMQYPKQSLDDLGVDFLSRVGVQAIRYGVEYIATNHRDYQATMRQLDEEMKRYAENNITVLLMFGEGHTLIPMGTPRSYLDDDGVYMRTKQDYVWLPSMDPDFKEFVRRLCVKHGWPRGPVTAVGLWNEPWEGISISGWQSDLLRYREIYKVMADAVLEAREEGADVLVGGCDSSANAWDKLFSDGYDMLPIFDYLSIHYQGMDSPVLYPEWNNRKDHKGRVLIWDTESWVGNTDDRIGLVVAANRAAGYDRSMGIYGGYMYSGDSHVGTNKHTQLRTPMGQETIPTIYTTWSPAAAMGAVQSLIGERDFNRLLFKSLPWVILFDGYNNNPDDGAVVVAGDLGEAFGAEHILFRGVRGLDAAKKMWELRKQKKEPETLYEPLTGGKMVIKALPSFRAYDSYGNAILPDKGVLTIPLDFRGYYLRTDGSKGSYAKLVKAIESSHIEGFEPLDIVAKDFLAPIENKPVMDLVLTNMLNRPVSGTLNITIEGLEIEAPQKLSFKPHEQKTIQVKVKNGVANAENTYPLDVYFDGGKDGIAIHWEDMHVNVISKRTIVVDGDLSDWEGAFAQTVKGAGAGVSVTEAAWYPFKNFDRDVDGFANGYLAYDDDYFYFAAKVADKTPFEGTRRFEFRDDDEFFYPDVSYMQTVNAMRGVEKQRNANADNKSALLHPDKEGERVLNTFENTETTQSIGFDIDLPEDRHTQVAIYFPPMDQYDIDIVVYDRNTGFEMIRRKVERIWDGAYVSLDVAGKVRIRCSAKGWWYAIKVGGLFFDKTEQNITAFKNVDLNTCGNWKGVYGKEGHAIIGLPYSLPSSVTLAYVEYDDKVELNWPEGVRHYSYRKDPDIPDGALGRAIDNVMIAFNAIPDKEDEMELMAKGTMPRFVAYKCTDYEYALNKVAPEYGGGTEIWRMLVPGMTRKHFFPRQPKQGMEGPVRDGKLEIRRDGNTLYTECAIPWSEIPHVKETLDKGKTVKFSFLINDNGKGGAYMELAQKRSVSKMNSKAFHPDWKEHWANEVEFSYEK